MAKTPMPWENLRYDVQDAIEGVWPDGVMTGFDREESYFGEVHSKLAAGLRRIAGTEPIDEFPASRPQRPWREDDDNDFEDDPPSDDRPSRSYHLFFISPMGEDFSFETEIESPVEPEDEIDDEIVDEVEIEDDLPTEVFAGRGRTGWSVAVSLLAPFATVTLGSMSNFEDGTTDEPSIEDRGFNETGERVDPEVEFRKNRGEAAFKVLAKLRDRITGILERHKIVVLPETEWRKPLPGMKAEEEVLVGMGGEPIRVLDALFFEML
jgi:hypothetical protein